MKAVVAAFNQEKALVGAFSVITNLRMDLFQALDYTHLQLDFLVLNSRLQEIRSMVDNGARMLTKKLHFQGYDEYCPINTTLVCNQSYSN